MTTPSRHFRTLLAVLAVLSGLTARVSAEDSKPNIVLIVADDLGWADVSFHGEEIQTPGIDRLVKEGAELRRFYVCPVCSPTRAGLMTGRYPIRFGLMRAVVPPWRKGGLDTSELTLPQALAGAGYRHRGIFGKWHLGHSSIEYHPLRRGFTEFVGHYNGAIDYFTHEREGELDWHRGYKSNHDSGYSTDLITGAAVAFIERHAGDDAPFFCYVPFNAPHSPLQAKREDLEAYKHLAEKGSTKGNQRKRRQGRGYGQRGRGDSARQTLAAMISCLDRGVGRILDTLDRKGIAEKTIVWFFSDNGGTGTGDNRPLRAGKGTVFEGGVRVAAALRWPGRVPAGSKVTAPLAYIDVLPTLLRTAGVEDHGGKPLDGIDVTELLTGEKTSVERDLYSYIGQQGEAQEKIALWEPEWKLVVTGRKITADDADPSDRRIFLFKIREDPHEKNDVAAAHADVVERMMGKLKRFRALQPKSAVPPYRDRDRDFRPPREWKIPD